MARQIFTFDPELGMKLIPNMRARKGHDGGGYLISSNSDGFRDDEFVKERRSGTRRILLYGDSFTFGSGVAKDVRFGELIESSIPNTEVYNLALVGSGIDQQFLSHNFVGSNFDHDLILISPWVEDAIRDLQQWNRNAAHDSSGLLWMPKPYFEIHNSGDLALRHYPIPPPVPYTGLGDFDSDETGQGRRLDAIRWRLRKHHPKRKTRSSV
jgi:hypothetical protein